MEKNVIVFIFTIGLFSVAMLPLLIDNMRTGRATNRNNLVLVLAGIVSMVVGHLSGWNQQSLWAASAWIVIGIFVLTLLSIIGFMPGGVAKTMAALLPWFAPIDYFLVITIGFIFGATVARPMQRGMRIAFPLFIASVGVLFYDFNTYIFA